uniref:microcephalin isoform X5 n=1 Tax=Myxine glutinosa TaxID=7769 RepID=UPI00358E2A37
MTCLGCTNEGKRIHALTQSLEVVCTVRDEAEDQEKENPFKDVVAFVEVWCSRKKENYSRSFDAHLIQLGAQVSKTFNKNVTHVVFKDGYRSTWKKAENKQVKLVSVLWVDSCVKAGKYLDEALFPASFEDDVTLPSRRRRPVPEPLNMDEWLITNEGRFQRELERRLKNLELEKAVGQASRILGYDDDGYPIYRPRLLSSPTPKIANSMANCLQRIKERRAFMSPSAPKKTAVIESSSTGSQENGSSSGTIRLFSDADEDGASTRHLQVDGDDAVQCCSVMLKPSTLTGNGTNKMRETNRTEEAPEDKVSVVHLAHYVPSSRKTRNSQEPITLVGEKSTSQAINMVQNTSITDFIVHTKHPKRGASSKNKDLCKRPQVKMVLVMTSMHSEQQVLVQNIVKHLGQCKICDNVSNRTTHVVAGDHRRTLNVLRGISQGSWILSIDWVLESEEAGYWVDEEPYEMTDSFPGARINRRRLYHSSTAPDITPLFSNEPAFYVCPSSSPPEECLKDLIRAYGGRLCRSPHRAGIYVGRTARNALRSDCRVLSERWVLDCITQYKVLPMDDYLHHRHHTSHGRP